MDTAAYPLPEAATAMAMPAAATVPAATRIAVAWGRPRTVGAAADVGVGTVGVVPLEDDGEPPLPVEGAPPDDVPVPAPVLVPVPVPDPPPPV
jgi:hypothetical protein